MAPAVTVNDECWCKMTLIFVVCERISHLIMKPTFQIVRLQHSDISAVNVKQAQLQTPNEIQGALLPVWAAASAESSMYAIHFVVVCFMFFSLR